MKKLILLAIGSFALIAAASAQTDEQFFKDDLQTISKEQKALKAQEKNERKTRKVQEAVFTSDKKADKAAMRKIENNEVSYFTKQSFWQDFGKVPVNNYRREGPYEVVEFSGIDGLIEAFYDNDAKLVGTTAEKQFTDLPQKAQDCLNTRYADFGKGSVLLFDDNEANDNDPLLLAQTVGADNYFIKLTKDGQSQLMRIGIDGDVSFYAKL